MKELRGTVNLREQFWVDLKNSQWAKDADKRGDDLIVKILSGDKMKKCDHDWIYYADHRCCCICQERENFYAGDIVMVDDIKKVPMYYDKSYDAEEKDPNGVIFQRFGRLVVIRASGERSSSRCIMYLCQCDCGNMVSVRSDNLRNGTTRSCGCLAQDRKTKHEQDPNNIPQHDSGAKFDEGKPDASLLGMFGKALLAVAEVGTLGARKYTDGGWQYVDNGIKRYTAAMLRHYFKEQYEDYDTNLSVLHASQVSWNSLARLELILREKEKINEKV